VKGFFYSFLSGLKINLVGVLAIGDVIAFFYSVRSIRYLKSLFSTFPEIRMVVKALLLFAGIQLLSDLYNHTSIVDTLRGIANILMTVFVIVFLTKILSESLYSATFIFLGFSLSALIFGFKTLEHHKVSISDLFFVKIRLVPIFNNLVLASLLFFNSKSEKPIQFQKIGLFFVFYGIVSMILGARSNSIFFFIPGLMLICKGYIEYFTKKMLPILMVILVVCQLSYMFYVSKVLSGTIKSPQMRGQLIRIENPYNPFDLLLFGRNQIYGSKAAIMDKPLLGHGSWACDHDGKYNLIAARLYHWEKFVQKKMTKNGKDSLLIPTHSILTGAWVSGGVFAFLSMLFIFVLFMKAYARLFLNRDFQKSIFFPILAVLATELVWNFLFSPLSGLKSFMPLSLVFILVCYRKYIFFESGKLYLKP
jgi:hypothetical protein